VTDAIDDTGFDFGDPEAEPQRLRQRQFDDLVERHRCLSNQLVQYMGDLIGALFNDARSGRGGGSCVTLGGRNCS